MAAVSSMSSAYEQRKVLAALAGAQPLPEPVVARRRQGGGRHRQRPRQAAGAVARTSRAATASPKVAAAALASAATIGSSHDKARCSSTSSRRAAFTDETAPAFFAAATTISSSHDLVARAARASPRGRGCRTRSLTGLVRAAGSVSSGYERATLLLEILKSADAVAGPRARCSSTWPRGISSSARSEPRAGRARPQPSGAEPSVSPTPARNCACGRRAGRMYNAGL